MKSHTFPNNFQYYPLILGHIFPCCVLEACLSDRKMSLQQAWGGVFRVWQEIMQRLPEVVMRCVLYAAGLM